MEAGLGWRSLYMIESCSAWFTVDAAPLAESASNQLALSTVACELSGSARVVGWLQTACGLASGVA